jgi:xeroderma pigmentosum group C-complementing protein
VAEEKARAKREERVIKQWTRLIHGLRIRQRLQEQYGTKSTTDRAVHEEDKGKLLAEQQQQQHADTSAGALEERDDLQVVDAGKDGRLRTEVERVRIDLPKILKMEQSLTDTSS